MKNMKKLAGLLLALVMVLSMAVVSAEGDSAATTYSITINNTATGHTYEAYQIFKGDLSKDEKGENVLSNIEWGTGISEAGVTALGDAAAKAESLKTEADAKAFADAVAPYLADVAASSGEPAEGKYTISGLEAGYYLVKDKDNSLDGKDDAYTEYMIKVVENVTAAPKGNSPMVEKKVKDTNDSVADSTTDWQDSADYDIGDDVPFQLKATLAGNVESYNTYKVIFHDTLSAGLTYNADAKVYLGEGETRTDVTDEFTITEENGTLTISCDNVKAFGATNNSIITVEYTAKLNENAVLGEAGNPNIVYLEYSNNPNWVPGEEPDEEDEEPTGETPEDKVIVFTYKVVVNKVTSNPDYDPEVEGSEETIALPGAGFTLYKKTGVDEEGKAIWTRIGEELKGDEMTTFEWKGLDDGDYKLEETTTPAGYNTIEPIEFTITAEHDVLSDNPALTKLEGGELATGEFKATGIIEADVVNQSGTTLPETGGIGTTIFYVAGGLLVAGAVILLVTKRRMKMHG